MARRLLFLALLAVACREPPPPRPPRGPPSEAGSPRTRVAVVTIRFLSGELTPGTGSDRLRVAAVSARPAISRSTSPSWSTSTKAAAPGSALKDGSFAIWKGPIVGQDGKDVLPKDAVADDKFLGGINFYVKGVEGAIPSGK